MRRKSLKGLFVQCHTNIFPNCHDGNYYSCVYDNVGDIELHSGGVRCTSFTKATFEWCLRDGDFVIVKLSKEEMCVLILQGKL